MAQIGSENLGKDRLITGLFGPLGKSWGNPEAASKLNVRFELQEVNSPMSTSRQPSGHLQLKTDKGTRTRSYYAYWREADGERHGRRLGPAHVKDSGRRTPRGAIIWRAGDGPKPTPEHLTPKDARAELGQILNTSRERAAATRQGRPQGSLREAIESWLDERQAKRGLKRSTIACYDDMFGRLCRDLGADTPVRELEDGRLIPYFESLTAERAVGKKAASIAAAEGHEIFEVEIESWTAQPRDSRAIEVATRAEAARLATELSGTWKHRAPGSYRVVPAGAQRPRRVTQRTAEKLSGEGWLIAHRVTKRSVLRPPASPPTHNKYRDLLGAVLDHAARKGWLTANPVAEISRASMKAARQRILRRADFYTPKEIDRLLAHGPGTFERAFWLCGGHAGLRLPGEALGLKWGAVDFNASVIRPYDSWVLNLPDDTKTAEFAPIPMTPRLSHALAEVKRRDFATADEDYVFTAEPRGLPVSGKAMREAFRHAAKLAGLPPIPMYNLRHSFGTTLASNGIDVRTIQALMRHERLTTTEQYLAYSPQPELANQIARALDPGRKSDEAPSVESRIGWASARLLERLEEEIPAKWLRELERIYADAGERIIA
jgi:integrase